MSTAPDKAAGWLHWVEWKRRCALESCEEPARAWLRSFAHHRFHHYVRQVGHRLGAAIGPSLEREIDGRDAWHLFETHLVVNATRAGKRYKDWLFARLANSSLAPAATIEAGATLVMRDVVREHVRRECLGRGQVSLQMPVGEIEGRALTLEELIPSRDGDPTDAAARAEYPALAEAEARRLMAELSRRTRVAILAKCLGRSLSAPEVERAAECRKSILSADYAAFRELLRGRIVARFADEGPAGQTELLLRTMQGLQEYIFLWGKSESSCARLFEVEEEEVAHAS